MPQDFPTLRGPRLILRPLQSEDAEALYAAGRDPSLWTYMPCLMRHLDDMRAFVQQALHARETAGDLPFTLVLSETGEVIGSTRFYDVHMAHRRAEIGYTWVSRAWQRTFVNTEAKWLLLNHAFGVLGLHRVALRTDARNLVSQRAIARLGATREGVLRRHMILPDGYVRDTVYFSITDSEWPGVRERLTARLGK